MTSSLPAQNIAAPVASTELPDVELPPELDRVLRDYERAWQAGDAAALASFFAADGFVLQSNRPPVRGRPAIQAAYEGQGAGSPLRLRALAFAAADTTGYIIGGYSFGTTSRDAGKFTLTLRRTPDGPWQIVSDMDNLNAPSRQRSVPGTPTGNPEAGQ
ncbi:DUF4440 domain-containing protein [Stenotrophomonas sp. Iso1]|uniref:YybH family protein n=1 Tax=Stenotrophomonas sp. Iso1 TaxID=2977283 RepID=UPI0022B79346|nr:DUF4440 domain-containing protein [Stenotrophomonas sp. Iso1]